MPEEEDKPTDNIFKNNSNYTKCESPLEYLKSVFGNSKAETQIPEMDYYSANITTR